ncbi:unnamed protein product, partial [Brassica oleracea]
MEYTLTNKLNKDDHQWVWRRTGSFGYLDTLVWFGWSSTFVTK